MSTVLPRSEYDIVVIGAGPMGLAYAGWVKKNRPATRIAVLEAAASPSFKIGESTLSSTIRNITDLGFTYPMLRRMFHIKAGLGYWWTGEHTRELHNHVDVVGLDETFQFERRVFEIAFIELIRSKGIDVLQGAKVLMKQSDIESDAMRKIVFSHGGSEHTIHTKLVCDATGPARVVSKHLGIDNIEDDDFNTNSYWAFFRWKKEKQQAKLWEIPVTRHLCFEDGWLWFIDIHSWEKTPEEKLKQVARHLFDIGTTNDADYPSRAALKESFGCQTEPIVSIGFVVRRDLSPNPSMTAEEGFWHYVNKYPGIKKVLEDYELIERQYLGTTFHKRVNIARRTRKVAGKGWLAVGEAAYLVDAFFSTGMNYGYGGAYIAAKHTVHALDDGTFDSERALSRYQRYIEDIFDTLYREIGMYYRAFQNKEVFERIMLTKIAWSVPDIAYKVGYTEEDPYVWNIKHPYYQDMLAEVLRTLRRAEAQKEPLEAFLPAIQKLTGELLSFLVTARRFEYLRLGNYFNHYNHHLDRDESWVRPVSDFEVTYCPCGTWHIDYQLQACPNCGSPTSRSSRPRDKQARIEPMASVAAMEEPALDVRTTAQD